MGAGAIAMGSRFICSKESDYPQHYRELIVPATAGDTVVVTGTFGPIRLWKNKYSLTHGLVTTKEEKMALEKATTMEIAMKEGRAYLAIYKGEMENAAYLLGQSAGLISRIDNIKDIVETIIKDAEKCLKNAYATIK
jgi:enoyl-[acyl-carrier protein] reductase II